MTVTYTLQVATSKFGRFLSLLMRWRGSIYKLVWREFLLFVLFYYGINMMYRFALPVKHKNNFHKVVRYCNSYSNLIPLSFILGFYVSLVVGRWWNQFCTIPWPDRLALYISCGLQGLDERGRLMRRTIMRYVCLTYVITLSSISPPVKKRFPTFTHMTEAGFMLPNEQSILEEIETKANKYFVPLIWSASLATRARKEGRIKDDQALKTIIDEINAYRGSCGFLLSYDWISIPLVYTQVVTLATYSFFLATLIGAQAIEGPNVESLDIFVPVFVFLQFFFYMGWLKVAETLVNPFGEDDDDFDINALVDRNLQISYLVVDEIHQDHPELIKDQYWDEVQFDLPYTAAADSLKKPEPFLGSAMDIRVDPEKKDFVMLESVIEGDEEQDEVRDLQKSFSTPAVGAQAKAGTSPPVAASAPIEPVVVGRSKWSPSNKLRKFFRSFSRDSRKSGGGSTLSLASGKRSKHKGSTSTVGSHERVPPSPHDEIFNMQDVSDVEGSTDNVSKLGTTPSGPGIKPSMSHVDEKTPKDTTKEDVSLLATGPAKKHPTVYARQQSASSRPPMGTTRQPYGSTRQPFVYSKQPKDKDAAKLGTSQGAAKDDKKEEHPLLPVGSTSKMPVQPDSHKDPKSSPRLGDRRSGESFGKTPPKK